MRPVAVVAVITLALGAAACVKEPDDGGPPIEGCVIDGECGDLQECRSGACFDKTTGAQFAADLLAPQGRTDMLARAEIQHLGIGDGNQVDVMFGPSIEVTGRVLLHTGDDRSIGATVEFRRPSRIAGASDYVVTVAALPGKVSGEVGYRARLVPTTGTETYAIRVMPDKGSSASDPLAPSALAPPTQLLQKQIPSSIELFPITLDAGGLRAITGQVVDAVGEPMAGMSVQAWNKFNGAPPDELVSSTGVTVATGRFVIYLPLGRATLFDLHVKPGAGMNRPSLLRKDVTTPSAPAGTTSTVELIRYPALPAPATFQLPVEGPDAAGGLKMAIGAKVTVTTVLSTGRDTVTYEAQGDVLAGGAELKLIPGVQAEDRSYKVTVIPLSTAQQGAAWDTTVLVGASGGVLSRMMLPRRASVSGKIFDASNRAATGIVVSPRLSTEFLSHATPATLARIDFVRLPEVTTDASGQFTMYLDTRVAGEDARYDLELIPPSGSALPRWSQDDVMVPADADKVDVGNVSLPDATFVSGVVKDEGGVPVAEAEVHVYMTDDGAGSRQRAVATSDARGKISLVLPAP